MFQKYFVLAFIFGFAYIPMSNEARADAAQDAKSLARAFAGNCVQNAGRTDKVASAAKVLGWKELQGAMKDMLGPQDPNAEYSGWFASEKDTPSYLIGISKGQVDGITYETCSLANPNVNIELLLQEIQYLVDLGPLLDDSESGGQRYRTWSTDSVAMRSLLNVTSAMKMGIAGGSVALSAPSEN